MACEEIITSEETYEFIVAPDEVIAEQIQPDCVLDVSERYAVWYYQSDRVPPISMEQYPYTAIPKCYGLLSAAALEASGITRLQNLPTLSLRGQGVFIAVIDTGIAFELDAFREESGMTRIEAIWDQTAQPPEASESPVISDGTEPGSGEDLAVDDEQGGAPYGVVYDRTQINEAVFAENPRSVIPETDENGHGTFLASIAAGSRSVSAGFSGAAPEAELIVVKLRPAKKYLRDYYFIPEKADAYAESDIMNGIAFAQRIAARQNRPLVILMGLGANNGSHAGTGPLCEYLDSLGVLRQHAVAVATGNEAGARHHFFGRAASVLTPQRVEIVVEQDMPGFYVEFWGIAPERFSLSVQSPTGEVLGQAGIFSNAHQEVTFLFEGTRLTVDYESAGRARRDQLVFLRFANAVKGVWVISVFPQDAVTGNFHMWLPMQGMLSGNVYFARPTPDVTITSPSDAKIPMTAGGYQVSTDGSYSESGRGFDADGDVKPEFVAPAVAVVGADVTGGYSSITGTSAAAALTAGACAQLLTWAAVQGNAPWVNSVDLKNLLIRGARRDIGTEYPSTIYGYGKLEVYDAFENIRKRT